MLTKAELASLKERWTPEALAASDKALAPMDPVAAYQGKAPPWPLQSHFGLAEGYLDFRCLPLGVTPLHRRLEKVDLSGATDDRRGQLHECTMINCKLDQAAMETNIGKHFERCSFVGARFSHSTWRGTFVECDFTNCDLSRSGGSQLKFIRCVFKDAKLVSLNFQHSIFDNCIWEGAKFGAAGLNRARFIGTKPTEEQLHRAFTPGMTFDGA